MGYGDAKCWFRSFTYVKTIKYYKNHRSMEWAGIYVTMPRPVSLVNSSNY